MREDINNNQPPTEAKVTISISDDAKQQLQSFAGYKDAPFKDMVDAFKFAVSMALAINRDNPPEIESRNSTTIYNMGTFDSDQIFREAFQIIAPNSCREANVARLIRVYAEWGIEQMANQRYENGGEFSILDAIKQMKEKIREASENS